MAIIIITLVSLSLLGSISAAPLNARQFSSGAITMTSKSNFTLLDSRPINAAHGRFWIGTPTSAHCTIPAPDCSSFSNTTTIQPNVGGSGAAEMLVASDNTQPIWVAQDGELKFAEPSQGDNYPKGAFTVPFITETVDDAEQFRFLGGNSDGFVACPAKHAGALPYQVFALVDSMGAVGAACQSIDIVATGVNMPGAYAYN